MLTLHLNYLHNEEARDFCFNFKKSFVSLKMAFEVTRVALNSKGHIPGDPKKYSRLTNYQIAFCSIVEIFLDFKCLFIDLDFETSTTQIQ